MALRPLSTIDFYYRGFTESADTEEGGSTSGLVYFPSQICTWYEIPGISKGEASETGFV